MNNKIMLNSITMENWKGFNFKSVTFNDGINFYNQENGFGKSSIIEAIFYCIYGKLPVGMKIKDLKKDKDKDIKLSLSFTNSDGRKYVIDRNIVGAGESKVVYFKEKGNDKEQYSITQINSIMEDFFGKKQFIDIIWSQAPLIYSGIFKSEFISNILSEYLQDAKVFSDNIKQLNLVATKEKKKIKDYISSLNGMSYEEIEKRIAKLKENKSILESRLKEKSKSNIDDSKKSLAERAIKAKKDLEKFDYSDIYSVDEISEYNRLKSLEDSYKSIIESFSDYDSEKLVIYNGMFSAKELTKLVKLNENGKCPVCRAPFNFDISKKDIENFGKKDKYEESLKNIERLNSFDEEKIKISKEFYDVQKESLLIQNPEEIINNYNKETEEQWKKLEVVNKTLEGLSKGKEALDSLNKIEEDIQYYSELLSLVDTYNKECINYYTSSLLFKATELLTYIDTKYMGLYFDITSGSYQVCIMDKDNITTRNVMSLSSGEKTVVALCLILACKEIFAPNSILILDESLGALDPNHLDNCLKIIAKENNQTIVVAHNSKEEIISSNKKESN